MFSAAKLPKILSFLKTQEPQFMIDLSINRSYATESVSAMIAMSTIKCERQAEMSLKEHNYDLDGELQ